VLGLRDAVRVLHEGARQLPDGWRVLHAQRVFRRRLVDRLRRDGGHVIARLEDHGRVGLLVWYWDRYGNWKSVILAGFEDLQQAHEFDGQQDLLDPSDVLRAVGQDDGQREGEARKEPDWLHVVN